MIVETPLVYLIHSNRPHTVSSYCLFLLLRSLAQRINEFLWILWQVDRAFLMVERRLFHLLDNYQYLKDQSEVLLDKSFQDYENDVTWIATNFASLKILLKSAHDLEKQSLIFGE